MRCAVEARMKAAGSPRQDVWTAAVAICFLSTLAVLVTPPYANAGIDRRYDGAPILPLPEHYSPRDEPQRITAEPETLWIFDADFEDLVGDNAGWVALDRSETPHYTNYWHKDTIRINGFTYLGDSTWWCGTYNDSCWRQSRGYGNSWVCMLSRSFPELNGTEPGDVIRLEYDQRYAMENNYDYGYTDVSADGGLTWETRAFITNPNFGQPGMSQNWNSNLPWGPGHMVLNLNDYAGTDLAIRFRFVSDCAYSSQDQYNNPPLNSCRDGAWQLDNIALYVNNTLSWIDDCEAPGHNGWDASDIEPQGQTGAYFRRTLEPETFGGYACGPPGSGWMMAAVDTVSGVMVDGQDTWLVGPPIEVPEEGDLYIEWHAWYDLPPASNDHASLYPMFYGDAECFWDRRMSFCPGGNTSSSLVPEGPEWRVIGLTLPQAEGIMRFGVHLWNYEQAEPGTHRTGVFLDRIRVGSVTATDQPTTWVFYIEDRFRDTFSLASALSRWITVYVRDPDGVASVMLHASNDEGETWHTYPLSFSYWQEINGLNMQQWNGPAPAELISEGAAIRYYLSATDDLGRSGTLPETAPLHYFEYSVLPVTGSVENPGILLVDKGRGEVPGDDRVRDRSGESILREALDILGYEYDVYRVYVPGSSYSEGRGPTDPVAFQAYDTHIWFTGELDQNTFQTTDQLNLIAWLQGSTPETPRRLFVYGNDIGYDLVEQGHQVSGFMRDRIGATYVTRHPGAYGHVSEPDTMIQVRDAGSGLMTYGDGECWLRCACPDPEWLDVAVPSPGGGAVPALEYDNGTTTLGAGVARVDSTYGYRVVYLPFGIELMNDGLNGIDGHYINGIHDRVDLVENIMTFLGKAPADPGTGTSHDHVFMNSLTAAEPNPFGRSTAVRYSVMERSRVSLRVYDLSGRVVRTLLDREVRPGEYRILWDGATDTGTRAASGVYFLRMEIAGGDVPFRSARKIVLLR